MRFLLLLWIFINVPFSYLRAQNDSLICAPDANTGITYYKKAFKYYKKAEKAIRKKDQDKFILNLELALKIDSDFIKVNYLLGNLYLSKKNFKKAKTHFKKIIEVCPDYKAHIYYDLALIAFKDAKIKGNEAEYRSCVNCLEKYMSLIEDKHKNFNKAFEQYRLCNEFNDIYNYPVPFIPKEVPGISSSSDEYLPILSPDNEIMLFTMRFEEVNQQGAYKKVRFVEKFYQAQKKDSGFHAIRALPKPFNEGKNTGGASMSISNNELYITICNDSENEGGGNCDIYQTSRSGKEWTKFKNLNELSDHRINSKFWEAQPSLSSDGKTLYFSSDKQSLGSGAADIFYIEKDSSGKWGKPIKMGPNINTVFEEQSPFIHPDNRTLYFSSEGHTSLGGKDIFYTRKLKNGKWSKAYNIGKPINDENDNGDFFVSTDGVTGYFAKVNEDTEKGWDVFYFPLHVRAKPKKVVLMKGDLKDENGNPIKDGAVKLKNNLTNQSSEAKLDENGSYTFIQTIEDPEEEATDDYSNVSLKDTSKSPDFDFDMSIQKEGYFYGSKNISSCDSTKLSDLDFKIKKVSKNASFTMQNLLFDTDSFTLKENSIQELQLLFDFLKVNNKLKISIEGHTDNQGSYNKNKKLSENRANSVVNYLINKGIEGKRLTYKGYGSSKPIASNNNKYDRQLNRRTEIKIIEISEIISSP